MADITKNQINLSPTTGYETMDLTLKADPQNPGNREDVVAVFKVNATDTGLNLPEITLNATIKGISEYVTIDYDSLAVDPDGGTITITGKSNAKVLNFSLGDTTADESEHGSIGVTAIIATDMEGFAYKVAGDSVTTADAVNGQDIPDDPGATHEYEFTIVLQVNANDLIVSKEQTLTIAGESASFDLTFTQAAGGSYLYFNDDPECKTYDIEIPQDGTEVTVKVNTNAHFEVTASD